MKLADIKYPFDTMILASILDGINLNNWGMSENGRKGINRPESLVSKLLGNKEEKKADGDSETITFDSAEAFEEMRNRLMGRR